MTISMNDPDQFVEGTSLMHLHVNQASGHSCSTRARRQACRSFRGSPPTPRWSSVNPKIVFCTISSYGMTVCAATTPATACLTTPGRASSTSRRATKGLPLPRARLHRESRLASLRGARHPGVGGPRPVQGEGSSIDIAHSDAWAEHLGLAAQRKPGPYERPESEVTGNKANDFERGAPLRGGRWRRLLPAARPRRRCAQRSEARPQ